VQFFFYLLVQIIAYSLDFGGFALMAGYLGFDPILVSVVCKTLTGILTFFVHQAYTFRVEGADGTSQRAVRYFLLLGLNVPLSAGLLSAMLWLVPNIMIARFSADVLGAIISYFLCRHFIFVTIDDAFKSSTGERSRS
jgi:putative flippase GtrA